MDLERLLRSVPKARRSARFRLTIPMLLVGPAFAVFEVFVLGYPVDDELLIIALIASAAAFFLMLIVSFFLIPSRGKAEEAYEKADYMYACISKLDYLKQSEVTQEAQDMGAVWRSKTYLLTRIPAPAVLGKHCLYGKVVTRKTFGINQHVILPYQNIAEVIHRPKNYRGETARTVFNALSVVGGVASAVTGNGGTFAFLERRPTIVVVDDAGNAYQIDCTNGNALLEMLKERLGGSFAEGD